MFYREHAIFSQRGVQWGDPLGIGLFGLVIQELISSLQDPDLNLWYLDDGTVAALPKNVLEAYKSIIQQAAEVGLELNHAKCEFSILGSNSEVLKNKIERQFKSISECTKVMKPKDEFLLGCCFKCMFE